MTGGTKVEEPVATKLSLPAWPLTGRMLAPVAFLAAAVVALGVAWVAALLVERISARAVTSRLLTEGITYVQVRADGLQVNLDGTAPNEAARYRVVNMVGSVVEASRIRDNMETTPIKAVEAPRFSVEMLRNDDGIQMIGLLPQGSDVAKLTEAAQALSPEIPLSDMIETAEYPAPAGWDAALDYGMAALKLLPRSKISVSTEGVQITAIATSTAEKRNLESQLAATRPEGMTLKVDISAPRPVLTPFTLRFVKDAQGARFDACSADTEAARRKISSAAVAAGAVGRAECTIGLGVPTPRWADAVALGIKTMASLPEATLTFSDADVSLVAGAQTSQSDFDRAVGDLENGLPDVFSLKSELEKKATGAVQGPAEFTAVLAPETHSVELRGRLTDVMLRNAVENFAKAEFGSGKVLLGTRLDPDLPDGWPTRVLAGLQALSELDNGSLVVRADTVEVKGITGSQSAKVRISQILSEKLGQGKTFKVDVVYDKELDPLAGLPSPQECVSAVQEVLAQRQITFTPGSAEISAEAGVVMKALAEELKRCGGVKLQVAGYTDSQGSEEGNRALSQARAESVILGLQGRQIDISAMQARGFGEADPIADNGTEAGREANRRIEFSLIEQPKPAAAATTGGPEAAGLTPPAEPAAAPDLSDIPEIDPSSVVDDGMGDSMAGDSMAGDSVGDDDQGSGDAAPEAGPADSSAAASDSAVPAETSAGPDFSGDTSPSVAPTEKTRRPKARPKQNG
jgi:OmpA-OmpF porin, OOP family